MLTKQEVKHIAKLARLGLTEKETEKYQKELSSILDYMEKLKEVDISGVKAELQPQDIEVAAREDAERIKTEIKKPQKLLQSAPETENSYLKVRAIFK